MFKKILTDLLGIVFMIAAVLLGWLPGPGGIPLFLAGLGLLAINHEWARRWLKKAEKHGLNLSQKIFRAHPVWQLALDLIGIMLLGFGIWLFIIATHNLTYALSLFLACIGLIVLLGNRKRAEWFMHRIKPQAK